MLWVLLQNTLLQFFVPVSQQHMKRILFFKKKKDISALLASAGVVAGDTRGSWRRTRSYLHLQMSSCSTLRYATLRVLSHCSSLWTKESVNVTWKWLAVTGNVRLCTPNIFTTTSTTLYLELCFRTQSAVCVLVCACARACVWERTQVSMSLINCM